MGIKKKYTASLPVQLSPEMRADVLEIADHEHVNDSASGVIREALQFALPHFRRNLGIAREDDLPINDLSDAAEALETRYSSIWGGSTRG